MSRARLFPKRQRIEVCSPCKHIPANISVTDVFTIEGVPCLGMVCKRCLMPYFKPADQEELNRLRLTTGVA